MNILIVDDDTALVAMLTLHFEERGFNVCKAHNCCETRTIVEERNFDLALVDYELPDGTGLELLSAMRKTTPHLKIIMMSGIDDPNLQNLLAKQGSHCFLSKPIESTKLDLIVSEALKV